RGGDGEVVREADGGVAVRAGRARERQHERGGGGVGLVAAALDERGRLGGHAPKLIARRISRPYIVADQLRWRTRCDTSSSRRSHCAPPLPPSRNGPPPTAPLILRCAQDAPPR